jgi:hypothetical protein
MDGGRQRLHPEAVDAGTVVFGRGDEQLVLEFSDGIGRELNVIARVKSPAGVCVTTYVPEIPERMVERLRWAGPRCSPLV